MIRECISTGRLTLSGGPLKDLRLQIPFLLLPVQFPSHPSMWISPAFLQCCNRDRDNVDILVQDKGRQNINLVLNQVCVGTEGTYKTDLGKFQCEWIWFLFTSPLHCTPSQTHLYDHMGEFQQLLISEMFVICFDPQIFSFRYRWLTVCKILFVVFLLSLMGNASCLACYMLFLYIPCMTPSLGPWKSQLHSPKGQSSWPNCFSLKFHKAISTLVFRPFI